MRFATEEILYRGVLSGNSASPTHVMFTADAQFLAAWHESTSSFQSFISEESVSCWSNEYIGPHRVYS